MRRTSEKMGTFSVLIYTLLPTIFLAASSVRGKYLEECERSYTTNSDVSLTCRLRTINSEFDKTNFSAISGDSVVSLTLECSDVLFYQSSLQPGSLAGFRRLGSLHIEHCKLSRLPPSVFAGLGLLKNLTIRTHNTAWPVLSLDIAPGVFGHLQHVEKIDLSANNIWTFPDRLFCPAKSLEALNVSLNRLQDISDLGFRESEDMKATQSPFGSSASCKLGLQVLDLSFNRLILLPPRSLAAIGNSLRELYLQGNEISVVSDRALGGLKALKLVNLSGNKLVALPETLFQESRDISEVYLQNNSLSQIPPKLVAKLDQLVVLDLSYNAITDLMMKGKMMISNEITNDSSTTSQPSVTSTTTVVTSGQSGDNNVFAGLIRLVMLNLSFNKISKITPEPFQDLYSLQVLDLSWNLIDSISPNSFTANTNLHTLILSHNKLTAIDAGTLNGLFVLSLLSLDNSAITEIHPTSFHNLSSINDINLNGNALKEIPYAVQNLTLLKTLDLGENQIEHMESPKLIGLPNLYGLRMTGNKVTNITKETLKDLPSLKIFNIARNSLQNVEKGAFDSNTLLQAIRLDSNFLTDISNLFADCPNLLMLNVSDNHITWFDYAIIPKHLQWLDIHKNQIADLSNYFQSPDLRLQTLDASFNRITKIGPNNIPDSVEAVYLNDNIISEIDSHTFYMKKNLSRVDIFANSIEKLEFKSLQLSPVPSGKELPSFYMGGNPFTCDCNLEWLTRINQLDHLRQQPKVVDLESVYCRLVHDRERNFIPLTQADPSLFLCPYETHCFATCGCCEWGFDGGQSGFDACDCWYRCPASCKCYHSDTWASNIVDCADGGLTSVPSSIPMDSTHINLDGNDLKELRSHAFIGRKNLQVLFLNDSKIVSIANSSFSGLKKLQILHLENNLLTSLDNGNEFLPMESSLRELYLHQNQLSYLAKGIFSSLKSLEVLTLFGNRLSVFSLWELTLNPYLVEIGLGDNPFSCECSYLSQAVPWIQSNLPKIRDPESLNCQLANDGRRFSLVKMNMNGTCSEVTAFSGAVEAPEATLYFHILIVSIAVIALFIGFLLVALCRKRHSLRIWAVAKCPLNHCYKATLDDDNEKIFDAYVLYSEREEQKVFQIFSHCENAYRFYFHHKDVPATAYLAENIIQAVESSKKTVIVLSKNFIQLEWCRFEFKSALHAALRGKKNRLVVINLGDLPQRDLDPDLRVCLRSATIMSASDKLFNAKLRCALPNPRASSFSSNRTLTRPGSGSSVASSLSNNYNCSTGGSTLPLNINLSGSCVSNHTLNMHNQYHLHHQNGEPNNGTISHQHHQHHANSVSVPIFVPPFPPPNRPPPPFPTAPRRPPPPAPLWA